jgi:putative membrane protein (TIGR04086 family)
MDISKEDISKEKNSIKIIKGSVIAIILSLIFLTIYAILLSYTTISENTMVPVIITITGISILIGSSISSMHIQKQGMLNGALVGLIYMLLLYILSSILLSSFELNLKSVIMIIVGIVTGMIGGIIGVNMK